MQMPHRVVDGGAAAELRSGYLALLGSLNIHPADGVRLAECFTGRSFEACGRTELEPVLHHIETLLHRLAVGPDGG
jgi:hypothetical protein